MYGKKIETDCAYCKHGYVLKNGDYTICDKAGVVIRKFKCRKFRYDPLKRIPSRPKRKSEYNIHDFEL